MYTSVTAGGDAAEVMGDVPGWPLAKVSAHGSSDK